MNKKLIYFTAVIALCIGFASCINITNVANITKRGNGELITSEREVSAFERIQINNNANVRFHQSEEFRITVTIDENLDEYVEVATRGNTLHIDTRRNVHLLSFTQFIVDVYAPTLSGVTVAGTGSFENTETLIVPNFETTISGSGRVTSVVESDSFTATISGSGRIMAFGSSENAVIRISGSGRFLGEEFTTNNTTARISGSGNVELYVIDNLNATISGSGSIRYQGNPRVESRVSGSGRIRRVD